MPNDEVRFTAEHEWVRVLGDGDNAVLRVGITDFAQGALGDIVFVTLPPVGTEFTAGQTLGEVESTKSVSEIYAPVAGRITGRNEQLEGSPELVNADPLGAGWMVELSPVEGVEAAWSDAALLDAAAYASLTRTDD